MPQAVRKARNQTLFREINESIAGLSRFHDGSGTIGLVCECHRLGCADTIEVPFDVYASVRDDPATFVVVAGHEDEDHEYVVGAYDRYLIVRNRPAGLTRSQD